MGLWGGGGCAKFLAMASHLLTRLTEKVRQAATEIHHLRKERERLLAEVALMQEESQRARRLVRDHEELLRDREGWRVRLEKILEKIDRAGVR